VAEKRADETHEIADEHVLGALHDVSNALTVMLGWIAEARAAEAPATREHALAMAEQRARVARDLARRAIGADECDRDSGAAHEGPDERALDALLREVTDALEVESARAGVRIALSPPIPSARVSNASSVAQILTNLLLNALAFSPASSVVTIEAQRRDAAVLIDVQDRGKGVEPARAADLWSGQSTREGGAGIGLRYARTLARAAGEELALVESDRAKPGARFRLTWPTRRASIPPPPDLPSKPQLLAGTRVLVVEDDADVAALLETALGARGAVVTVATSVEALRIAAAQAEPHDAALLDLSPIAHDLEGAIACLRERSPDVRLVFISGSAAGLPDALASEPAPPRWVRKPFEVREVVEAIADVRRRRA
jgi:CheY-like chemotaxis protein